MPTVKLIQTNVDKISPPASGQVLYWDETLKGFGLRVTPGTKSYFAEARVHGKTRRVKIGSHGAIKPDQARDAAKILLGQMTQGQDPNSVKADKRARTITLGEVFEEYKRSRRLRESTLKAYEGSMRRCFSDWLTKPINEISKEMIEKRHKKLSTQNGPRGKGEAQADRAMRELRAILNYAAEKYEDASGRPVLTENPVKRLSKVKAWNGARRRQSVIQAHQLGDWCEKVMALENDKNNTMRDYLLLCLFTGLRRNEAAALRWQNIDFKAETLSIPAQQAKNKQEHRLPLSRFLVALLDARSKVRSIDNPEPYVFPGKGRTGHLVESKFTVGEISRKSGVKFMIHDLRRTFLTVAEGLDIPHYALKKLANHKSNDVTAGYIVSDVERLRKPMELISETLCRHAGIKPGDLTEVKAPKEIGTGTKNTGRRSRKD